MNTQQDEFWLFPNETFQTTLDKCYLIYIFLFSWSFITAAIYFRLDITIGYVAMIVMCILTGYQLYKKSKIDDIQRILDWTISMMYTFAIISILTNRLSWYWYETIVIGVFATLFVMYTLIKSRKKYFNV